MTEQLDATGKLRHLLTLDGLPRDVLERLLDRADALRTHAQGGTGMRGVLAGKAVCTLFFEPSTRTRSSFQLAAARLGARFAAKEAAMKALGVGLGAFKLRDVEVVLKRSGAPVLRLHGAAAALASERGVGRWHVSLTHTALTAQAIVIAEA